LKINALKILISLGLMFTLHGYTFSQKVLEPALDQFLKFNSVENGWCASDATISLLLPDGKTLWLWGDCIVGLKTSTYDISNNTATMINNASIIEDEGSLRAYYTGTWQDAASLIPSIDGNIFWPEHATIENDTLKIFAIQIIYEDTGVPGFNFRVGTTHLAYFKYPEMKHIRTEKIKYITDSTMRFGTHVFEHEGYKYIFGKKDTVVETLKYPVPMLARVQNSVDEPWQFYAGGDSWSYDCNDAVPIGDRPMSESYFVYEKDGKFYLIMHEIWFVQELYILQADSLTGPWNRSGTGGIENKFAVIHSPEVNFTYNLFAHPQFKHGEDLLISYNVNNHDFWPIFDDSRNYRARFYWMDVDRAVSTATPDTLDIWEYFESTRVPIMEQDPQLPQLEQLDGTLYIENVRIPTLLEIYGPDGRKWISRRIFSEGTISLAGLPENILLVRLRNREGASVTKIFNSE
jgi:hypothetical protein